MSRVEFYFQVNYSFFIIAEHLLIVSRIGGPVYSVVLVGTGVDSFGSVLLDSIVVKVVVVIVVGVALFVVVVVVVGSSLWAGQQVPHLNAKFMIKNSVNKFILYF